MRSVGSTSSVPSVVFGTVENNTEWLYALYEKSKVAVGEQGAYNEGQLWDDIGFSADALPYQMYKTVVKVNGQPYDAETLRIPMEPSTLSAIRAVCRSIR